MEFKEYLVHSVAMIFFLSSGMFLLLGFYPKINAKIKICLSKIYLFFNSEPIKNYPKKILNKNEEKFILFNEYALERKYSGFIRLIDLVPIIPVIFLQKIPYFLPSVLFKKYPGFYWLVVMVLIILFLRSLAKNQQTLKNLTGLVFLYFCFDIFRFTLFFLVSPKVGLVKIVLDKDILTYGLNYLFGYKVAVVVMLMILSYCAHFLLYIFLSACLYVLTKFPGYLISGVSNAASRAVLFTGILYTYLFWVSPGEVWNSKRHFVFISICLVFTAIIALALYKIISYIKTKFYLSTLFLLVLPSITIFLFSKTFSLIFNSDFSGIRVIIYLILFLNSMIVIYVRTLFFGLTSLSIRISRAIFSSEKIVNEASNYIGTLFALIATLIELVYLQVVYLF